MEPGEKQGRIKLSIPMPSVALSRFIEKVLRDDASFEAAVEDPLAALQESGVRLDVAKLTPGDLAAFFAALASARGLLRKRQTSEISFEGIFGRAAEVQGTRLTAETQKGMWTQFQHNAVTEREMHASASTKFEATQALLAETRLTAATARDVTALRELDRTQLLQVRVELEVAGASVQHRETDTGVTFHFDANRGVGSSSSSKVDTYSTKNFDKAGMSLVEQLLVGPLINPADLRALAARIDTYVQLAEQTEGF